MATFDYRTSPMLPRFDPLTLKAAMDRASQQQMSHPVTAPGFSLVSPEYRAQQAIAEQAAREAEYGRQVPSQPVPAAPVYRPAPSVPAYAPRQPRSVEQGLPRMQYNARSDTNAYDIAPGTNWRPKFEGYNSDYKGPLDYIRVSRDPKTGTLSFSGTGQKINQNGTTYQAPPAQPVPPLQRDMAQVRALFQGGTPQTKEDWALFNGLLNNMMTSRENSMARQSDFDRAMATLMGQAFLNKGKAPSFKDQLGPQLYGVINQMYKDNPQQWLANVMSMYTGQQQFMPPQEE